MKAYYARRAAEYDATSWEALDEAERARVERFVASLPAGRVLDIGCGTGYLTRFLRGRVVGVDQSAEVLEFARARLPGKELVCAEAPLLPFADGAFDLAFSSIRARGDRGVGGPGWRRGAAARDRRSPHGAARGVLSPAQVE